MRTVATKPWGGLMRTKCQHASMSLCVSSSEKQSPAMYLGASAPRSCSCTRVYIACTCALCTHVLCQGARPRLCVAFTVRRTPRPAASAGMRLTETSPMP